jgi:DNA-binding NarL/FixJ family response regulator
MKLNNFHKIKIAYAEKYAFLRCGVRQFFHDSDRIELIIEAATGGELLGKLEKAPVLPDVCILDVVLPEINGFDAMSRIRKKWPETKLLVFTGLDNELCIARIIKKGANGYLHKDCNYEDLKTAVNAVYDSGTYFSNLVSNRYMNSIINGAINVPEFSDLEMEVLRLCCTDYTYEEIAQKIGISFKSVDGTKERLLKKLNLRNRFGLMNYAFKTGLV